MWAALCARKQQAVQDDFAKQGVFYLSVFSGAYLEAWGRIYKYETKKNRTSPFCAQFSQVIWHVGLVFWEEQLWLQNHHICWQILSHVLVDEQSLLQNLSLQKLLCPFQKGGEVFPFSCPSISVENCSYRLLWLWFCHLAALHCWILLVNSPF